MTIGELIKTSQLSRRETEILLAFLLKRSREALLAHPEIIINKNTLFKFKSLEKKRLANWPIAYLTGQKEFYSLAFKVSPAVLVPRPETEMMVEEIITLSRESRPETIIDLGTGSGAIIIAVAQELTKLRPLDFKKITFKASDISAAALKIATLNAHDHKLGTKIKFVEGDLLRPFLGSLKNRRLIIAANLPYLTPAQVKNSPSIQKEPRLALIAGSDGLKYYRRLFKQLKTATYKSATVLCEIDPVQRTGFEELAKKYLNGCRLEIKPDLAGQDRLAIIKIDHN